MSRPLTIGLATLGLPFTGTTLSKHCLGGSETALLSMARALAGLGHHVLVFCNCEEEGTFDGVTYYSVAQLEAVNRYTEWDVFIASRWPEFLTMPNEAAWRVLWLHDTLEDKNRLGGTLYQTDEIFLLSDYHIENYVEKLPHLSQFMWKTSNGIDPTLIDHQEKVPLRFFYSSRPERGLLYLLRDIWPRVINKYPDATLHYCHYTLTGMQVSEQIAAIHAACNELAKQPSVKSLGSLTKQQLYVEMSQAQALLYPTDFNEISCITAMEAAACRTPIITTADYALLETVGPNGFLIDGKPGTEEYTDSFLEKIDLLLSDPTLASQMQDAGPAWIKDQGYTWQAIAKKWETRFYSMLATRAATNNSKVVEQLLCAGNVQTARELDPGIDVDLVNTKPTQEHLPSAINLVKKQLQAEPELILELGASGFARYAASEFPDARVIQVENGTLPSNLKADVVFASDYLETLEAPWEGLQALSNNVKEGGVLAVSSRVGTVNAQHDRLWSLNQEDYLEMLGSDSQVRLTFIGEESGEGSWVCVFNCTDFKSQPINSQRRIERTRPYQSLAVCMIVRDGEDFLYKCLKSLEPIADKIIVALDTATTDNTRRILKEFDVEIRDVEFDHFSQMRNASIENVDTDWILYVDADEVLVDGFRVKRYLQSRMLEGFAIKQCHLSLDIQGTFDTPIRLFRNRKKYRFVGCVHEHCEDTSKEGYGNSIRPVTLIPDARLAHYGYLSEQQRRSKCSSRNLPLLARDQELYPGRQLTWMLLQRSHLNVAMWGLEQKLNRHLSDACKNLEASVDAYLTHLTDPKHPYHAAAFPMYQHALQLMNQHGLCYRDCPEPPFKLSDVEDGRWFVSRDECSRYFAGQKQLPSKAYSASQTDLLDAGINKVHPKTGLLK